jgi:N-acyl-D-amino-acid deacylase
LFDLLIAGGRVHDGTGAPGLRADVGIAGGRVAALGRLDAAAAADVIDASGRLVLPGFVDAHSHADALVLDPAVQLAALRQGVTTLVLGQDGLSFAPTSAGSMSFVTGYFAAINGIHPDLDPGGATVAQLRATWHHRVPVNTAYLVPHGTIRHEVIGGAPRLADPDELAVMVGLVEQGLAEGAVGLSTGLEYVPGRHADVAELVALCRPVSSAGLPYVTHIRGYGLNAPQGMDEVRSIMDASGVAGHVSHYHGPGELLESIVERFLADGLDITFDTYPYRRGSTILAMLALPRWLDAADPDRVIAALSDPSIRSRVANELNPDLLDRVTLAHVPHHDWEWAEGMTLTGAAARVDRPIKDLLLDLLQDTHLEASAVVRQPPTTDPAAIRRLLRQAVHMGGSDGIFIGRHPHPRGWGAFARYLGRHVRELADWSWSQAAVHLAAHPARRFGLTDRGVLRPGLAADLSVVDPAVVIDRATYADPRVPAVGVGDVIVNGVAVLRHGELTGATPGAALTPH